MRILSSFICLVSLCFATSAFAQDSQTETPAVTNVSWVSGSTDSNVAWIQSLPGFDAAKLRPQRAAVLRRATGAAFHAVNSGLVLFDAALRGADTCVYVKFGSDGMPRLRWRTRF